MAMDRPMNAADRTVICTLGMHRSGTSLVSRILNLLGVYLGAAPAISGAGSDNPKGHWEHHPIALLNDDILVRYGGRWDVPPAFPPDWTRDAGLIPLKEEAARLLTDAFGSHELWGWKDPRTCLTAAFWQDLVGPMRYVLCVRNPLAVAASLERRDRMLAIHADRLWLLYVAASLIHSRGYPRIVVFYEDLMADWPRELRRLAAFIGRPDRAEDPEVTAAVSDFIAGDLHHHRPSSEDLAADTNLSFETKSLYLALRAARGALVEGSAELEWLAVQAVASAQRLDAIHVAQAALAADHAAQAAAISQLTRSRDELTASVARLTAAGDEVT